MKEDILFRKFDPAKTDFNCSKGEVRLPKNLIVCEDGRFAPAPDLRTLSSLPNGVRPLYIHQQGDSVNLIATDGTALLWSPMPTDDLPIAPDAFTIITHTSEIKDIAILNGLITVATEEGLLYLSFTGSEYIVVPPLKLPEIEFGLQKAGNLVSQVILRLPSSSNLSPAILKAFDDAVTFQILAKGYFHMPFLLKYALRLYDGTHIMASSPLLMLPTVLSPCIALTIDTDQEEGITCIQPVLTRVIYHQLRYRIKNADIDNLKSVVAAIDIFATPMIPTYDIDSVDQGYITTYQHVLDTCVSPLRGRNPGNTDDEAPILDGHYSSAGDIYTDHYLEQSVRDSTAIMLYPNPKFRSQITNASEYHLIASLPINNLEVNDDFQPLPISPIADSRQSFYLNSSLTGIFNIKASSIRTINDNLMLTVKALLPRTDVNPITLPYYNDSTDPIATEISVHIKSGTHNCVITYTRFLDYSLSSHFPRYLFFPHSGAYKITLRQGSNAYDLPLTPHLSITGSYWFGLSDTDVPIADTTSEPEITDVTQSIPIEMIMVSEKNSPLVFNDTQAIVFGADSITAIAESTKSPKAGAFGRYPAYVFSSSGIWMFEYSASLQRYISRQKITRDVCPYVKGITEASDSIFFATATQLLRLDSTDSSPISTGLDMMGTDITSLPHYSRLLEYGEMEQTEVSLPDILKDGTLAYDTSSSMLLLSPKESDYSLAYLNGTWTVLDFGISSIVKSNTPGTFLNCPDGKLCILGNKASKKRTLMITRPIKCNGKYIKSIEIIGCFLSERVAIAVYGSHHRSNWHLCASSTSHYVEIYSTEPFYRYIIVVFADLDEGEYLLGASIEYTD